MFLWFNLVFLIHDCVVCFTEPRVSIRTKLDNGDEDDEEDKEPACDTLIKCIVTTLNLGLRNGGGIGDALRQPSSSEQLYVPRGELAASVTTFNGHFVIISSVFSITRNLLLNVVSSKNLCLILIMHSLPACEA